MNKLIFNIENHPVFKKLETPMGKNLLGLAILAIFFGFYLFQNLFFVNGLNDFDEYFIRAEMWVNKEWNWGGGPDKLLSFIEYLPIKWYQHNFMALYRLSNIILVIILFGGTAGFIIKKSDVFPTYFEKLCIVAFFITMPVFVFHNLTIDASALLGSMLLIFFISYNNKYLGWVSLLVYLSRPEGIIIIFFYILFLLIDKKHRKSILINLVTFLVLLITFKIIESKYIHSLHITGISSMDSSIVSNVEKNYGKLILDAAISVVYIPVYMVLYGMEILQNKILFFFYILGLVVSLFNKRMWVFFVMLGAYAFLYIGLNQFNNPFQFGDAFKLFASKMEWFNHNMAIGNGREMEFNIYGHTRYRVFLYPGIAAFVIAGLAFSINFFKQIINKPKPEIQNAVRKGGKRQSKKDIIIVESKKANKNKIFSYLVYKLDNHSKILVTGFTIIFVLMNYVAYKGFSEDYKVEKQMNNKWMNDIYKLGFDVRKKMKPNDAVFMPNLCNCNRSFIIEFVVFSGTRYTLTPVCEKCDDHIVYWHPEQHATIKAEEIEKQIPSRLVFFDRYAVDYKKTFNDDTKRQINALYQKFDLTMLDSLNVRFIISTQSLTKPNLSLLKQSGQVFLYENHLKTNNGKN